MVDYPLLLLQFAIDEWLEAQQRVLNLARAGASRATIEAAIEVLDYYGEEVQLWERRVSRRIRLDS